MSTSEMKNATDNLVLLLNGNYPFMKAGRGGYEHFDDYKVRFMDGLTDHQKEQVLINVYNFINFNCWTINDFMMLADAYFPAFRSNAISNISTGLITNNINLLKVRARK